MAADWRTPFNPFTSVHEKSDFTEGNPWQYTWLVPHDVEDLVGLLGSEQRFSQKLDLLFVVHLPEVLHQDLLQGGTLVFEMGSQLSPTWGVAPAGRPKSVIEE